MPDGNPLVARPVETTNAVTGIGIAESCVDVANGISSGDWVEAGLGLLGAGLEVLSMVIDPLGTLASYGVSWLIEHVRPLKEALDWFAGDPPVIRSFSETWGNVAAEVDGVARDLQVEANSGTSGWSGVAADAYRRQAAETADAVAGAGALASGISAGVMIMGEVVAFVREFIRDMVGELVGRLISWALEVAATLGLATPLVVAQATAAISKVVNKVADLVRKLVKTIGNVAPRIRKVIDKLDEIIQKLSRLLRRADSPGTPDAPTPRGTTSPSGTTTPSGTTSPSGTTTPNGSATPSSTSNPASSTTTPDPTPNTTTSPGTRTRGPDRTDTPSSSRPDNPNDTRTPEGQRNTCNDPIDVASGEMVLAQTDVELGGLLPLVLSRVHVSSYRVGRSFGPSWASTVDQRLEADHLGLVFVADDGMRLVYPRPAGDEPVLPEVGPRWPLRRGENGYRVTDPRTGQVRHFTAGTGPDLPLSAITDRNGNRVDFTRDIDGAVTEISHSGGYRLAVDGTDGLITALRLVSAEPEVPLVRFGYNEERRLVEVVNSSGLAMRFDYDTDGRITGWQDRNGSWYRYGYDELGRCVRNEGSGGFLNGSFDYGENTTVFTDSLGARTVYHLNELRQVVRQVDPLGGVTHSEWDRYDRLLARTDPLGRTTSYTYDEAGNPTSVRLPDGSRTRAELNEFGQPLVVVEPDGATWRREYDERGNLLSVTDPTGALTRYAYGERGFLESVTDAAGSVRRFESDVAGLVVAESGPDGATVRYERDVFGRVLSLTDPLGATTRLHWTVEGNLRARVRPDGATERWAYDGEGNRIAHTDAAGRTTRTEYTHFDLPSVQVGADGARYEFGYDTALRLVSVTNAQGMVWRYTYDAAGRLIRETDFDGRVTGYGYDAAGQLTERQVAGRTTRYTRDLLGNVVERRSRDTATIFEHDAASRIVRAVNDDAELVFEYDPLGRVLAETCNGRTVRWSYDPLGRRVGRRTPSGAESAWEFDPNARPLAMHAAGHTVRFSYDLAGREFERRIGDDVLLAQSWDVNNRLLSQTLVGSARSASARMLQRRRFGYAVDGSLTAVEELRSGTRRFELDPAGRVAAVTGPGWSERYGYDLAGNVAHAAWPTQRPDAQGSREYTGTLLRRAGNVRYEYDAAGRMVLRQRKRPSSKPDTWRYEWNDDDRLTAVVTPDGRRWRYRYDPLGRRIAKQRMGPDGTSVVEQVDFAWDGTVLAEQTHTRWDEPRRRTTVWEWEPGQFRPVSQTERVPHPDREQDWYDEKFYAIVTDLVGSPAELVDPDGEVVHHAGATLWGLGEASSPLRFPGHYHDPETGLHYNYFRYYDPVSARYATGDPLGLAAAPNPRAYVMNPTREVDPLGLAACDPRNQPGTAGGSTGLGDVNGQWLRGSHGNAGPFPGQIARQLEGQQFNSFRDFREAFWRAVAADPNLRSQFSASNIANMEAGHAPFVHSSQSVPGQYQYSLHHRTPIQHGGGVYDMRNLIIVTPRYHAEVLSRSYHYGNG